MSDCLICVYNEETGMWEEKPEPFVIVEYQTEEDFKFVEAAVKHYSRCGKWVWNKKTWNWYCSECDKPGYKGFVPAEPDFDFCPHCGVKMHCEQSQDATPPEEAVEESNFFMERFMRQE